MSVGMGVLINELCGSDSGEVYTKAIGKEIASAVLSDSEVRLGFTDGTSIYFSDDGQSCCESRYFTSDDDLEDLVGGTFVFADVVSVSYESDEKGYEDHEIAFLKIQSSTGSVTVEAHNRHNGYYGGFSIRVHEGA